MLNIKAIRGPYTQVVPWQGRFVTVSEAIHAMQYLQYPLDLQFRYLQINLGIKGA